MGILEKGWYKDPHNPDQEIWWDGMNWHPDATRKIDVNNPTLNPNFNKKCLNCFRDFYTEGEYCPECGVARLDLDLESIDNTINNEDILPDETIGKKARSGIFKLIAWGAPFVVTYLIITIMQTSDLTERNSSGEIINGGQISFAELQVGDCFNNGKFYSGVLGTFAAVPCEKTHDYEVYASTKTKLEEYDQEILEKNATKFCEKQLPTSRIDLLLENSTPDLKSKLNLIYSGDSGYYFYFFIPTYDPAIDVKGTWESGDRQITCYLGHEDFDNEGTLL